MTWNTSSSVFAARIGNRWVTFSVLLPIRQAHPGVSAPSSKRVSSGCSCGTIRDVLMQGSATVGVVENGNAMVLVTVAHAGTVLDRRRIELTDGLPTHPHHHEGSWAV